MQENVLQTRTVVRRQLHDEVRRIALEERVLEDESRRDAEDDARDVDKEDELPRILREKRRAKQNPDRELRPAAHERRHEDREEAVALRLERARRHDRRHRAAEADEHRDERLARKPDSPHEAIHHERRAGHVAGVLEKREGEEHEADRRQEREDGLHGGSRAVRDNRRQPLRRVARAQEPGESRHEERVADAVEEVDERPTDNLGKPKDQVHDREEYWNAQETVEGELVDPLADVRLRARHLDDIMNKSRNDTITRLSEFDIRRIGKNLRHALNRAVHDLGRHVVIFVKLTANERIALQRLDRDPARRDLERFGRLDRRGGENVDLLFELVAVVELHRRHLRLVKRVAEGCKKALQVLRLRRVDADHRHAEVRGEMVEFNDRVALPDDVHHRDDNDHRHVQLAHEERQVQVSLQRRRVENVHIQVGLVREHVLERRLLVLTRRRQRIDAGQVDDLDLLFAFALHLERREAFLLLHRHARPVARVLMRAREPVEERRLAAVRIADNANRFHHLTSPFSSFLTLMTPTSSRRSER